MYRHLLRWRDGERPGPLRLHVVLTERCNLRCHSCFMGLTPARNREREVPDALLLRLADDAVRLGVKELYLVGGEIFLRRDVALAMMERIKSAGLFGDLTTNGTLIDDDAARRIVAMGWDRLQVSLDGPDAAVNDGIRPPWGSFDRVMASVERIRGWKARLGLDRPAVTVSTVVSNRNHHLLPDMLRLAAEIGASDVSFQSLKDRMSAEAPSMMLDEGQRREVQVGLRAALERAEELRLDTNLGNFLESPIVENIGRLDRVMREDVHDVEDPFFRAHCFVPWYYVVVHYDGRVSPCWEWTGDDMGNVKDTPLDEIWHGPLFERFRREFQARQVSDHCAQCCLGYLNHTRWLREMGLLASGNHREALKVAERLLASTPLHHQSVEVKARCLYHLGRREEARDYLRHVVEEFPPDALAQLAHLLDVPGAFEDFEALGWMVDRLLERVGPSRIAERGGKVLVPAAYGLARIGRHAEALAMCERLDALGIEGGRQGWQARLQALYGLGRRGEARSALERLAARARSGAASELAEALYVPFAQGDPEGCLAAAEAFAEADPDCAPALALGAASRVLLGDLARGPRELEEAVALDPGDAWVRELRLRTLYLAGRRKEAAEGIAEAMRGAPASEWGGLARVAAEFQGGDALAAALDGMAAEGAAAGRAWAALEESLAGVGAVQEPPGGEPWEVLPGAVRAVAAARAFPFPAARAWAAEAADEDRHLLLSLLAGRIDRAYAAGERDVARELLRAALEGARASDRDRLRDLVYVAHRRRDPREAMAAADRLGPSLPGDPWLAWLKAAACGKIGRRVEALRGCRGALRALEARPEDFADAVQDTLASLALSAGDAAAAAAWARRALGAGRDRPGTRRTLTRAEKSLAAGADPVPRDPVLWIAVGREHFRGGRSREGAAAAREAMIAARGDADLAPELAALARDALDAGALAVALDAAGAALEREAGSPLALAVRGAALADLGRGEEAKAACRAALRSTRHHHGPPEDIACDALGRVALAEGAEGAAAVWFERALAIDPLREGARRALEEIRSRAVAGPGPG